jgi:hypothetical protein
MPAAILSGSIGRWVSCWLVILLLPIVKENFYQKYLKNTLFLRLKSSEMWFHVVKTSQRYILSHIQGGRMIYRQEVSAKCWYLHNKLHAVTCKNIVMFIVTAMKTSYIKYIFDLYIVNYFKLCLCCNADLHKLFHTHEDSILLGRNLCMQT